MLAEVGVSQRPRVAVVSTGAELVAPGAPVRRGEIPYSNGTLLAALAIDARGGREIEHEGPGLGLSSLDLDRR